MQQVIINIMENFGYIGIFLLIMIENIFPPIPSEVILLFGGFMTSVSNLTIIGVIVSSTMGSLIGAIVLYYVGKIFNQERLAKIVDGKIGKLLHLDANDIDRANNWFTAKGIKTVFFCRFVPVLRSLISIPAGMNEMNMPRFLIYTTIGSVIWNTILTILGYFAGSNWESILKVFDTYSSIVTVILVFALIGCVMYWFLKKEKEKIR